MITFQNNMRLLLYLGPDFGVRSSPVIYLFRYLHWAGPPTYYLLFKIAPGLQTLYESLYEALEMPNMSQYLWCLSVQLKPSLLPERQILLKKDWNWGGIKGYMRLNGLGLALLGRCSWGGTRKPRKINNVTLIIDLTALLLYRKEPVLSKMLAFI